MSTSLTPPAPQDQLPRSNAKHIKLAAAGVVGLLTNFCIELLTKSVSAFIQVVVSIGLLIPLYRARPPRAASSGQVIATRSSATVSSAAPADLLARRQRLGTTPSAHTPATSLPARPKALTAAEQEAAATEVGLGFNPAAHVFGAFGLATLLVFAAATGSVYAIQRKTEAQNVRIVLHDA